MQQTGRQWPVPVEGFDLARGVFRPRGDSFRSYDPLERPGLARILVEYWSVHGPDGLAAFIDEFGFLDVPAHNPGARESLAFLDAVASHTHEVLRRIEHGIPPEDELLEAVNDGLTGHVSVGVSAEAAGRRFVLVPHTLLGAMNLQVAAEAVGHAPKIGVCEVCGRVFTRRRSDQRFCSEQCRKLKWWQSKGHSR